ncbi:glycerophosphodiester phosphodiesterase family protein [Homoserinibacter sp. YIM 151385]|uniref:glycerophosphodiester phosphodiesterase family protein n=1 Tax=Homoserinibacter sp. YIM 151385 TaxID=2985506 RepID=UPI0022F08FC4|nr:glycerophosphodiester phosphodiesterase family protein [Homoserinibacter sp. YIM 151385]WBU38544.1 glycerophosphodiester phosphodiesterase family protein [Homoserinibacter sp. YIM 151385]
MARRPASSGGEGFLSPAPPRILAHRGLALEAPENSLLAFAKALAIGVTHLETDVHGSADGVSVVSHDPDLVRVAGRDVRVAQLTMAELRRIPLGEAQGYSSLAEALDAFPDARFNIDIKSEDAIAPTIAAIREARAIDRVLISSFSRSRRRAVVEGLPGVATSLSASEVAPLLLAARLGARAAVRRLVRGIDAVQIPPRAKGIDLVPRGAVEAIRAAGVELHIWTVNDPAEMHRLLDLGVDGLVTDRADLAVEVLAARA